jgi:hypothetical protein
MKIIGQSKQFIDLRMLTTNKMNTNRISKNAFHQLDDPITESQLQKLVVTYLKRFILPNHPTAILITNPFSEMKLSFSQISKAKSEGWIRSQPDVVIVYYNKHYTGLVLELKTKKANPYRKDGALKKNKHLHDQNKELDKYTENMFKASFGVGLKDTLEKIDNYFKI